MLMSWLDTPTPYQPVTGRVVAPRCYVCITATNAKRLLPLVLLLLLPLSEQWKTAIDCT